MSGVAEASARPLQGMPSGWTWARLGDICDAVNGRAFNSSEWHESGLPIVRIQNLKNSEAEFNYFAGEVDERHRVRHGDLLFAWSGTPGTSFGAYIWTGPDAALNQHIFNIKFDADALDPRYFCLALNQNVSRYVAQARGGVGLAHITKRKFLDSYIPLAPKAKQLELVAELEKQFSRLDQAVANLKRVKANLDRYVAATLAEAFAGRWAGNADDWRPVPLRDVADVQLGQQRAPVHAADLNPIPYIRAANVTWRGIDVSDVKFMGFPNPARYRLAFGDILLAEASGSASEVGKPAVWRDEVPGACYQKTLIRVRCKSVRLSYQFAYYFFLHTCLSGQFARLAPGVGILHLTAERMLVWPTVAPPLQIQASIVAELDRRLSIVREVEAEVDANLKRAHALRQAVLAKAFGSGGQALDSRAVEHTAGDAP